MESSSSNLDSEFFKILFRKTNHNDLINRSVGHIHQIKIFVHYIVYFKKPAFENTGKQITNKGVLFVSNNG